MKSEILQGLLYKLTGEICEAEELSNNRKYFLNMAKFKYDGYKQFSPGMRFIERFALWLNQFKDLKDRKVALDFVKNYLVYISGPEMDLLVSSCYPDVIKPILFKKMSIELGISEYKVHAISNNPKYKSLLRQSLFCGLSDGARMEIFRRSNTGLLSHEQIYQTYELSAKRANKMQEELVLDQKSNLERDPTTDEDKFKLLFLLDDFSASGTSYLKFSPIDNKLKGKINALYESIYNKDELKGVFDLENLEVHIVLYLCTEQAKMAIEENFQKLKEEYDLKKYPELHIVHLIPDFYKISLANNQAIIDLCMKDAYYDGNELEDKHTGEVRLGFSECALPVILYHNCPNNSLSILWAYENAKFGGLFPRIPRHKEL
ncbi:MAG TPA: hypothetical protein VIK55_16460 [Paludibacter sp.]